MKTIIFHDPSHLIVVIDFAVLLLESNYNFWPFPSKWC